MKIDSYSYSNIGGRKYNEDYVGEKTFTNGNLFVLADGLGGHQHGELASKLTVETLLEATEPKPDEDIKEWFEVHLNEVNKKILSLQEEKSAKIKTTVVTLYINEGKAFWAHIGDSRLYYIHKDKLHTITEDHSVAFKKYKAGEITKAEIAKDEDQSSLLRALGNKDRSKADYSSAENKVESGDGFMLCSDGVWEYLYDNEVLFDFLKSDTAEEWAELMLMRIIDRVRDDFDNLSMITVRIQ